MVSDCFLLFNKPFLARGVYGLPALFGARPAFQSLNPLLGYRVGIASDFFWSQEIDKAALVLNTKKVPKPTTTMESMNVDNQGDEVKQVSEAVVIGNEVTQQSGNAAVAYPVDEDTVRLSFNGQWHV